MPKFVKVSTTCPFCRSSAALFLEQSGDPSAEVLARLGGTRLRCRNGGCKKSFALVPDQASIGESP